MRHLCTLLLAVCACSSQPPSMADGGGTAGGSAQSCDAGFDDLNCGTCGHVCSPTQSCGAGTCLNDDCSTAPCADFQVCRNELCVDRLCLGVICPMGQVCARGLCLSVACGAMTCAAGAVCENGQCIDAACAGVICPGGQRCQGGICGPLSCFDGIKSGAETGKDCGGPCAPCRNGESCSTGADCLSGACNTGVCGPAGSCSNGVRDGTELDVDCGGGACPPCATGRCGCLLPGDCVSNVCQAGCCVGGSCTDGLTNGTESDRDCGGDGGCMGCADGLRCRAASDCGSRVCGDAGTCSAPACGDGAKNGRESDVDCGGDGGCAACGQGRFCVTPSDCMSRSCTAMRCDALSCGDNTKNGSETDTDCGGACPSCMVGQMCLQPEDCTTRVCIMGTCRMATCNDGIRNGNESGVDCGGSCFPCGFAPPVAYPHGGNAARGIVTADFNSDGKLDLATANYGSQNVSVLFGNGDGTFQNAFQYSSARGGYQLFAAEISGDTHVDLLVHTDGDALGNTVQLLINNGDGTFALPVGLAAGNFFDRSIAFADINQDGELDIAMGENSRISLRYGNGNTTFRSDSVFFCAGYVNSLAVADFTSDGRPDLIAQYATGTASAMVLLMAQQPDGGFPRVDCLPDGGYGVPEHVLAGPPGTAGMSAADINSDGRPDLLGGTASFLAVAFGQGDGGFVNGPSLAGSCVPGGVIAVDVNRDSGTDLVGACTGNQSALSLNLGQGSAFQQTIAYPASVMGISLGVAIGDFDRDGRVDAVLSDAAAPRVLVYLNRF